MTAPNLQSAIYIVRIDNLCEVFATVHLINEYEAHENSKMFYQEDRDIVLEEEKMCSISYEIVSHKLSFNYCI